MDVDDRCDGEWDEYQRSEGENKTPRQSEGRCVARVLHTVEQSKDSTMQMVSLRGSVRVPATVLVSDGIVKDTSSEKR